MNTLSETLKLAAVGKETDIKDFFKALLSSTIFIPSLSKASAPPVIGALKTEADTAYQYIDYEEARCIPIFSSQEFLEEWADGNMQFVEELFSTFMWKIPHDVWAYLDPGQDIGKELSPWEIELLKLGEDSFEELIHGVQETEQENFEIEDATETLNQAKAPLINILEAYQVIEECFLLALREAEGELERALIGIRYNQEIDSDKRDQIRQEIASALKDLLPKPYSEAFIVDDLIDPNSMNHALFLDYPSFYKKAS